MNNTRKIIYLLFFLVFMGFIYLVSPLPSKVKPYTRACSLSLDMNYLYYNFSVYAEKNSGKLPNNIHQIFPDSNTEGSEFFYNINSFFNAVDRVDGNIDKKVKLRSLVYEKILPKLDPSRKVLLASVSLVNKYIIILYHNGEIEILEYKSKEKVKENIMSGVSEGWIVAE